MKYVPTFLPLEQDKQINLTISISKLKQLVRSNFALCDDCSSMKSPVWASNVTHSFKCFPFGCPCNHKFSKFATVLVFKSIQNPSAFLLIGAIKLFVESHGKPVETIK